MSRAYISGLNQYPPCAEITFDRFHIIQLANQAVDAVRKAEVRHEARLKHTKWAWRIKEALRAIFPEATSREEAEARLKRWHSWARRCRLEPVKQLAATLKRHWAGVLQGFESRLSNGYVEAMNSLIQAAKARARGYGTTRHFIAICFLIAGKLRHLPENPFQSLLPKAIGA